MKMCTKQILLLVSLLLWTDALKCTFPCTYWGVKRENPCPLCFIVVSLYLLLFCIFSLWNRVCQILEVFLWQLFYSNGKLSTQALALDNPEFMTSTCSVSHLGKTDSRFIAENSYLSYGLSYQYHGFINVDNPWSLYRKYENFMVCTRRYFWHSFVSYT